MWRPAISYYTAETHICHLGEAKLGDRVTGTMQILSADEKRFHSFVRLIEGRDECVATIEQMCLHVDMKAGQDLRRPRREVWAKLQADRRRPMPGLPLPEGAGRAVGQRK